MLTPENQDDQGWAILKRAYASYPRITINASILSAMLDGSRPDLAQIKNELSDNVIPGIDHVESTIAHEIGHYLHQRGIINFKSIEEVSQIEYFMMAYPLTEYAGTDVSEYIAEAFAGMMISEDGIGKYPEVAEFINSRIEMYNRKKAAQESSGPSPKQERSSDAPDKEAIVAAVNEIIAIHDIRMGKKYHPYGTKRYDEYDSSKSFNKHKLPIDNIMSIQAAKRTAPIQNSARAKHINDKRVYIPTQKATDLKNKITALGNMVLDKVKKVVEDRLRSEGLLPEGIDVDQHRAELILLIREKSKVIQSKKEKFKAAKNDLVENAFKNLSPEDLEKFFEEVQDDPAISRFNDLIKEKRFDEVMKVFQAESWENDGFNSEGFKEKYGDIKALDTGAKKSEWIPDAKDEARRSRSGIRRVKGKWVLVDDPELIGSKNFYYYGGPTVYEALTVIATNKGYLDTSELEKMAAELKSLREEAFAIQNPKKFAKKVHEYVAEEVKKSLQDLGVEFDSVDMTKTVGKTKPVVSYNRYGNRTDGVVEDYYDLTDKIREEFEKALDSIPKSVLTSIKEYIDSRGKVSGSTWPVKIGIKPSEARAHIYTARETGSKIIRGSSHSDFLHEIWHLVQEVNEDIRAIEHAFTYDRIKNDDGTVKPVLEIPYVSDTKSDDGSSSFSDANIVNPYILKQYRPRRNEKNIRLFSMGEDATEVFTNGMDDLFGGEDIGKYTTPDGITVVTGKGGSREYYKDPHMDIATGIWYTDDTMTNMIDPKKITGIFGLDSTKPIDWDFKALSIGMLLALVDLENN